ncbi:two-component sensor histidine kinase [Marivirga lumbricoides]|uniref:histidine kinase n=1 Tax=Marivirga lumbricoides TaxID=1046115 RepID=A0A2T4DSX0_9BACT|nr:two-component sensor histidine kinase [Marivirga lumbricoides]
MNSSVMMKFNVIKGKLILFMILILTASVTILTINYYSLKINASIRAYINGESLYAKGQKDATYYLSKYLYFSDSSYISQYQKAISIPVGDKMARVILENDGDEQLVRKYFIQGNNHPEDIDNMIWLFKNFNEVGFFQEILKIWIEADSNIEELNGLADDIFSQTEGGKLANKDEKKFYQGKLSSLNKELSSEQYKFSATLAEVGRKVEKYLLYFNFIVIIIILFSTLVVIYFILKRLDNQNRNLKIINHELDKFVYSTSHDLRAPISSLKGLVYLACREKDPENLKTYFKLMTESLERQDNFISEIIDLSRNKRIEVSLSLFKPEPLIDQVIENHQFMQNAKKISFEKKIEISQLKMDKSRFMIIVNNLVSNAIKYHDSRKLNKFIRIELKRQEGKIHLEISDNGIGIKPEHKEKIFEMFFVTQNKSKGSGLGLYIVSDVLEKIGGIVKLESEWEKGSKFIIQWPDFE